MENLSFKGATVLITGASSGIGKEFAKNLAAQGANLIITARSESELTQLATDLESLHSDIWVKVITQDLSEQGAASTLYSTVVDMGLSVDYLINNAGFGKWCEFLGESLETYQSMLALNINALVELSYYCLPSMIKSNRGGIINVASTAAFQPLPYQGVYAASKAFVLSFSESLSGELLDTNVRVMALCPGITESKFMSNANADTSGMASALPSDVVNAALSAYGKKRIYTVVGCVNYLTTFIPRLVTRKKVVSIVVGMFKDKVAGKSL